MMFFTIQKFNVCIYKLKILTPNIFNELLLKLSFLSLFFKKNELLWQEGLLIDFLQKKSFDLWLKKFLIYSSYFFNEKLLFEKIIKFFINLIIKPAQIFFIFETLNISNFFFINIFFYFLTFFLILILILIF